MAGHKQRSTIGGLNLDGGLKSKHGSVRRGRYLRTIFLEAPASHVTHSWGSQQRGEFESETENPLGQLTKDLSQLGWMSIASWFIVTLPQVYETYSFQNGDGVSVLFILTWLMGDLLSAAGAIKGRLLATVITLAVYVRPMYAYHEPTP